LKYLLKFLHHIALHHSHPEEEMRLSTKTTFFILLVFLPSTTGYSACQMIYIRILKTVHLTLPDGAELVWKTNPAPKKVTLGTVGRTRAREIRVESPALRLDALNGGSEPAPGVFSHEQKKDACIDRLTPAERDGFVRVYTLTDE
jgi:hypothetical protein